MALSPDHVRAYREDYRTELIGSGYRGWLHVAVTSTVCLAAITAALTMVEDPRLTLLPVIPLAWFIANLIEYALHRGPMHHLGVGLGLLYRHHTSQHHRFFIRELMDIDSPRDFRVVLFPARISLLVVAAVAVPMVALAWLLGRDVALLSHAALMFYYLVHEWSHLCAHMPADSPLGRLASVARVRRRHAIHHDPMKMRQTNFNFAVPLGDWLFGTLEK